jgi:hypothetical protein
MSVAAKRFAPKYPSSSIVAPGIAHDASTRAVDSQSTNRMNSESNFPVHSELEVLSKKRKDRDTDRSASVRNIQTSNSNAVERINLPALDLHSSVNTSLERITCYFKRNETGIEGLHLKIIDGKVIVDRVELYEKPPNVVPTENQQSNEAPAVEVPVLIALGGKRTAPKSQWEVNSLQLSRVKASDIVLAIGNLDTCGNVFLSLKPRKMEEKMLQALCYDKSKDKNALLREDGCRVSVTHSHDTSRVCVVFGRHRADEGSTHQTV